MISIELASQPTVNILTVVAALAVGIGMIAFAAWHMLRARHPLVDLTALHARSFAVTIWGGSLFRIAISSAPFLLPLMFQVAFGWSAVRSGLLILALFAGNLSMKPATSWIMRTFGFRTVLLVNGLLVALGFGLCALLSPSTPLWLIAAVLFFSGLCRSMQFTVLNTLGFADLRPDQMSGATTLFSVFQQMNAGMGIAFGAVALRIAALLGGNVSGAPTVFDFHIAFAIIAVLASLALLDVVRLPADVGAEVSGHRAKATG